MTNTMTPSEIAEALDAVVATQEASKLAYKATELAATTIRELELKLDQTNEALIAEQFVAEQGERLFRAERAKLKIATEALEGISLSAGEHMENGTTGSGHAQSIRSSRQALARIKEVG